jgi:hypothetical protein
VLFAVLVCTDSECDAVYEAWCDERDLDRLACELSGCGLQTVAVSNVSANGAQGRSAELHLRDAA